MVFSYVFVWRIGGLEEEKFWGGALALLGVVDDEKGYSIHTNPFDIFFEGGGFQDLLFFAARP